MQTATMNDVDAQTGVTTEIDNETDDLGKEEQKSRFILLRAKGLSYAKIAKDLKVSTSTLTNWNQELLEEIAQAKSMDVGGSPGRVFHAQRRPDQAARGAVEDYPRRNQRPRSLEGEHRKADGVPAQILR